MSCNGCRALRKGCGDACALRPCLQWIESPEAQGHATLFVARFFGRAGLVSFISAVPAPDRPALFQSLLFEACGRAVNPVGGAVGLLQAGNWHLCQAAVETVLHGGTLGALPPDEEPPAPHVPGGRISTPQRQQPPPRKRRMLTPASEDDEGGVAGCRPVELAELELCLTTSPAAIEPRRRMRPGTPSEGSVTTSADSGVPTAAMAWQQQQQPMLLNLFV